jgi:hypothetical protein
MYVFRAFQHKYVEELDILLTIVAIFVKFVEERG